MGDNRQGNNRDNQLGKEQGGAVKLPAGWKAALADEITKPYFQQLRDFVRQEYVVKKVFPHPRKVFAALQACDIDQVKVVILGQDPYHTPGMATGLSFSVPAGGVGGRIPPSLQNIFKEVESDTGKPSQCLNGDLTAWAEQGVLLLNATLTVQAGKAGSHQGKGWEEFTDKLITKLAQTRDGVVYLLWGNYAREKKALIGGSGSNLILEAAHPSPFSAHKGFFGCQHFSKANQFLAANNQSLIVW
jgi:uracil-DNA glycosylase